MNKFLLISIPLMLLCSALHGQTIIHKEKGKASFYADKFQGHKTANGESYDRFAMTCAHRKLPFGTLVKVTNIKNKRWVVVRVNDRGPFSSHRIIDVSRAAAAKLDMVSAGSADIELEVVDASGNSPKLDENTQSGKPTASANEATYDMQGKKVSPTGLGIQIGSYSELGLAQKQAQSAYSKGLKEMYIQASLHEGRMVYRVLYSNKDENSIKALVQTVKSKGFGSAFIRPHLGH